MSADPALEAELAELRARVDAQDKAIQGLLVRLELLEKREAKPPGSPAPAPTGLLFRVICERRGPPIPLH